MPVEDVKITFYRVKKCGYYGHGAAKPSFSGLPEVMKEIQIWSQGVPLALTKLSDGAEDVLPVYLFGIIPVGTDWVLATWNEVPAHEGHVASVPRTSVVGQAKVNLNAIGKDDIPGYPTYFWVLPDRNLIASVRFTHPVSGQEGMRQYIEAFLHKQSKHVVVQDKDGDKTIGFSEGPNKPLARVSPRFVTQAYFKTGDVAYLKENVAKIRKVKRRGHLTVTNPAEKKTMMELISYVRGRNKVADHAVVRRAAYVEFDYSPDAEELDEMIKGQIEDAGASGWDDMGFVLKGESDKTYWLSRSSVSENFDLDVQRDAATKATVTLESLAAALIAKRNDILKLVG